MNNILVFFINIYQKTLSPDHGWFKDKYPYGFCRHFPTCSEYSKQALQKHGIFKGIFLSIKRVIKCNPWIEPRIDTVPNKI